MKKISYICVLILSSCIFSCASLPNSTITLTNEIIKEANDMHALNISLVNQLFEERLERVNLFIENKYVPTLIKKYEALLPENIDYKKELPNIIESIVPVVNRKKDSILAILKDQNTSIVNQLNTNFNTYTKATISLQNLIKSAVKIKTVENDALASIEKLTGTTNDVSKVKSTIETFLDKSGNDLGELLKIKNQLTKIK